MKSLLRYRKPALIISTVLFVIFFLHLTGVYVFSNGKYIGLPGGSVSVGLISEHKADPMNPLNYGSGQTDDFMYNMLFRSLIRYNSETEIYEWDLANCDISNLLKISCELREDAVWSDGTNITGDDIIATANIFKEKASSKTVRTALSNAKITSESRNIIIESKTRNNGIIEALSYPILRTDVIDQIRNNRLKKESYITSGPFIFEEIFDDQEFGFHRITLKKNPNYKKSDVWLEKFHFKIFPDTTTLGRGIGTVDMVIPSNTLEPMKLTSAFKEVRFNNYEFYGIFFQTNRLDPNLRNILHNFIAKRFEESAPAVERQRLTHSIFHNGATISGKSNLALTLSQFMADKSYKKKSTLLAEANAIQTTLTDPKNIEMPKTKYFRNGGWNAILYSDDPKAEISLFGNVPTSTTAVKVNNYQLQEYSAGNSSFVYKISADFGTLKNGKNEYVLSLPQKNGSTLTETLTIYHATDKETMSNYQRSVEKELLQSLNSWEKIAEREAQKNERIAKIQALSDTLYYNDSLEPFTLKLAFVSDKDAPAKYAEFTAATLSSLGIHVEQIPLTTKDLSALITSGEKNYDMIIVGLRSGGTIADLGNNFFSSENGNPNFSNLKSKNFVDLFDGLKNIASKEKAEAIHSEIANFMNEHSFFFPISQPERNIYIHRDVKWFAMPQVIASLSDLSEASTHLSKKDEYHLDMTGKSIWNFFSWIFSQK